MLQSGFQSYPFEAGCDEAGRGCLAGPVFAAAVVFPQGFYLPEIQDSKKLSESKREKLRNLIEAEALSFSVQKVEAQEIDQINILQASIKAMHKGLSSLAIKPNFIIIDGNYFLPYKDIPYACIIKGDTRFISIASASILAKTYRDEYMLNLHHQFPEYGWNKNKGYPTREHRLAIQRFGFHPEHRKTFQVKEI